MSAEPLTPERVEPDVYTDQYYLTNCHGYEDFVATGGHEVGPRFRKALQLAGDLSGKRVLDIGCGRGELVLQSAMRGADAWGIDYAPVAVEISSGATARADAAARERTHIEQMDVKAMQFDDASFDVVFMMDVVEHLYPHELARAFDEIARVMRPGGLLVLHTSPNKVFEEKVYPNWSRHVNRVALDLSKRFNFEDKFLFNEFMLPDKREFPRNRWERAMHINEQTMGGLRRQLRQHGFRIRRAEFWEPPRPKNYFPTRELNRALAILDFIRFLRPISSVVPPLDRIFCNHMWITARRAS